MSHTHVSGHTNRATRLWWGVAGRKRDNPGAGFSLIELLVVVAILAVLAAIAIPLFLNQKKRANDGVTTSDVHNLGVALAADFAGPVTSVAGSDGAYSPTVTVNGDGEAKNGATVYADVNGNWCASKQSNSGKVFVMTSTNRNVYEATNLCTSATVNPTSGVNSGGTIVSAVGNLFSANQASFEDGTTVGWQGSAPNTVTSDATQSVVGSRSAKVVGTGGGYVISWLPSPGVECVCSV